MWANQTHSSTSLTDRKWNYQNIRVKRGPIICYIQFRTAGNIWKRKWYANTPTEISTMFAHPGSLTRQLDGGSLGLTFQSNSPNPCGDSAVPWWTQDISWTDGTPGSISLPPISVVILRTHIRSTPVLLPLLRDIHSRYGDDSTRENGGGHGEYCVT